MKKRYYVIGILIFVIILVVALFMKYGFDKKEKNHKTEDKKESFKNEIEYVLSIIENNSYDLNAYDSDYNRYYIENNTLYGYNFNSIKNENDYNLNNINIDYNYINDGLIIENKAGDLYLTVSGDEYCAIKSFESNDIEIYDLSSSDKCHKAYLHDGNLSVEIISHNIESNESYNQGEISANSISLIAMSNLLDSKAATYTWYRNNEKIKDSNVQAYTITSYFEDADYYVEITTNDGQSYKSESVNVKIDRR